MSVDSSQPLTQGEFAALIAAQEGLPAAGPWGLAVSGGPDSMALAFCAQRWFSSHEETESWPSVRMLTQALQLFMPFQLAPVATRAMAFIVDHSLRKNSAAEAAQTRDRLARMGLRAEVLRWEHPPIHTRIHVQAREARYRLLTDACKRYGIAHLLIAHQMEDQAETVLMRIAKGSGVNGLSGIPRRNEQDGVTIWRPLLGIPRARLAATCVANNVEYFIDPSNTSDAFARGRLRRVIPFLKQEGLSVERLSDLASRAEDAREALDAYRDNVLREAVSLDEFGVARVQRDALRNVPREIALRVLVACLRAVHPESYAPERAGLLRILESLRGEEKAVAPRTLQGCLIGGTLSHVTIMREVANIADTLSIRPGETAPWDERWLVSLDAGFLLPSIPGSALERDLSVRPLGSPEHALLDKLAPGLRHRITQGRARASLPALWLGETLIAVPVFGEDAQGTLRAHLLRNHVA